ncbi:stage II sporulation protein R [Paenibacillus curdlanolyticus YK9]|uniref:Stage II sporulation protein R n=1 Tax=Paenibacillus curdlanolyticus YK9 TaxID=717606 RepID=E0IEL6_9BACL|nr:stage II sporulation protein R [Paenibacillus curdlanolyticus]EFM09104.1 stage II sporulation protein R [Paenibacillus curdlanolyticus YK9]
MIRHHSYYSVDSSTPNVRSEARSIELDKPRRSRFAYRPMYGYLIIALFVLVMSWEQVRTDAAAVEGAIPEQSIRLRILANSDNPVDQAVKRHVRDAVVQAMNSWVAGPSTIEAARETIRSHMGEIEKIVAHELEIRGFDYGFKAELAVVPFPTKMYGNRIYPAGDYEALRITLGKGAGQNWWCVLFPPLCFVDAASGEAEPVAAAAAEQDGKQPAAAKTSKSKSTADSKNQQAHVQQAKLDQADKAVSAQADQSTETPQAKFFIVEIFEAIIGFFRSLFA